MDLLDLVMVLDYFEVYVATQPDLDGNYQVTLEDLTIVLGSFGLAGD